MTDFSHLQRASTPTAEYFFYALDGQPSVTVRPANSSNKPFMNDLLKSQSRQRRQRVTADTFDFTRRGDIVRYSKHVVTKWQGITDVEGKDVALSVGACQEFLRAIPSWMFDELRDFSTDALSFEIDDDADGDEEDAAKN